MYISYRKKKKRLLVLLLCDWVEKKKVFCHQSEARIAPTVWNWSVKTLSPGALTLPLGFSSPEFFSRPFRLPRPQLTAPGSPSMSTRLFTRCSSYVFLPSLMEKHVAFLARSHAWQKFTEVPNCSELFESKSPKRNFELLYCEYFNAHQACQPQKHAFCLWKRAVYFYTK